MRPRSNVVIVVVIDERDVKKVLALMAMSEGFIIIEAYPHVVFLYHLLYCKALEGKVV